MRIKNDTYVQPTGGSAITGFAVVADPTLVNKRPQTMFDPPAGSTDSPIFSGRGEIYLESNLDGRGSITTEKSITFQGTSALETTPGQRVALYAQENIEVLPIPSSVVANLLATFPPPGGGGEGEGEGEGGGGGTSRIDTLLGFSSPFTVNAQDVAFGGILYALGNVSVDLTSGGGTGNFFLRGTVSAYGGDPELNQDPGALAGVGAIAANVTNAFLVYDPSFLAQSTSLDVPTTLVVVFQAQQQR